MPLAFGRGSLPRGADEDIDAPKARRPAQAGERLRVRGPPVTHVAVEFIRLEELTDRVLLKVRKQRRLRLDNRQLPADRAEALQVLARAFHLIDDAKSENHITCPY